MRRRRGQLLVPEARDALNQLRAEVLKRDGIVPNTTDPKQVAPEVAKEVGVPYSQDYNGNMTTKNAGRIGGNIGGRMVKELVRMAQEQLANKEKY